VFNLVRALVDPYPNAFSFYKDQKIYITEVELYDHEKVCGIPGKVGLSRDDGVLVMCRDQALLVKSVKFEGDVRATCARGALIRNESFITIRTMLLKGGGA
jgi:methionyl-tRNA formyltransferase